MEKEKTTFDIGRILSIALRLVVICAIVAALVAFVNAFTKGRIEANAKNATALSLSSIYAGDGYAFRVNGEGAYEMTDKDGNIAGSVDDVTPEKPLADVDEVYKLTKADGSLFGCCVKVSPMGFNDDVEVLVAVDPDGSVRQVAVKQQDTPGKGDKSEDPGFLGKFTGKTAGFITADTPVKALKEEGFVIAGATRTSKPVALAVETALEQLAAITGEGN